MRFLATSMPKKYLKLPKSLILKYLFKKALRREIELTELLGKTMSSTLTSKAAKEVGVMQVKRLQSNLNWVNPNLMREEENLSALPQGLFEAINASQQLAHLVLGILGRTRDFFIQMSSLSYPLRKVLLTSNWQRCQPLMEVKTKRAQTVTILTIRENVSW